MAVHFYHGCISHHQPVTKVSFDPKCPALLTLPPWCCKLVLTKSSYSESLSCACPWTRFTSWEHRASWKAEVCSYVTTVRAVPQELKLKSAREEAGGRRKSSPVRFYLLKENEHRQSESNSDTPGFQSNFPRSSESLDQETLEALSVLGPDANASTQPSEKTCTLTTSSVEV